MSSAQPARAVMVLGCTSGAGKSWIATALCRWYASQGMRVAPFKAQNMSNHARVVGVPGGGFGEMGSAQYFQARAAGIEPDVRMNPILLKPESDTRSQVVVLGRVREELGRLPWRARAPQLWDVARQALAELQSEFDLLVIEGAGSPAEINLADVDYVNTATARASAARCLLVANIDHGGAFAHLYGTALLMDPLLRPQLAGFVLNRFRGDAALLSPGPERLQALTGVATLAVIPFVPDHGLPEEDAVPLDTATDTGPSIVVVAAPHASNLDEFAPLRAAGVRVVFTRDAGVMMGADWLILPGSKQARADLAWMRARGIDAVIREHAGQGRPLLALCGGLQIAGMWLSDPEGLEGPSAGTDRGLGLLPLETHYSRCKRLARTTARFELPEGPWKALHDLSLHGYEIHLGHTTPCPGTAEGHATAAVIATGGEVIGWCSGSILGCYLHGLFEQSSVVQRLFGVAARESNPTFTTMAEALESSFGRAALMQIAGCA